MCSVAGQIVQIIKRFSYQEEHDVQKAAWQQVCQKIIKQIADKTPILLVLPAFPLKNPNRDKTLGPLPDLGEELALARLDRLCSEISQVYEYGARISIVSDGLVYGDLMGVADSDSFQYGESLRSLAARKRFRYITFLRVPDILSQESGPTTSRDVYLTAVPYLRKQLETFLNPHINIESEIDGNEDTMLTYQSFVALLAKDMPWRDDFDKNLLQDERRYNQEVKKLAECMVKRLIAYERLLYEKFANSIRLSIHLSTGQKKIYIPLLSGKAFSRMNPWNCCILVMANGEIRSGYAKEFSQEYDLVEQDGQPYFFKERSER